MYLDSNLEEEMKKKKGPNFKKKKIYIEKVIEFIHFSYLK